MGSARTSKLASRDLPAELAASLREELSDELEELQHALLEDPPISIRINAAKPFNHQEGQVVPWCASGRYLSERPRFTLDPLFHAGCYYAQEASSMFLEQAVIASGLMDRPILALDLCAAPGGKSTHLLSILHPDSLLVSNELVRSRQASLIENIWKWGTGNCVITGSAPDRFLELGGLFDMIVIDAPCSGEGMFRKDPFAREQWSTALVEQCALRQRSILDNAWQALLPGGVLVYSTCTWERSENEDQVLRLISESKAEPIVIPCDPEWNMLTTELGRRFYPHRVRGEGFFIAMLRKPGTASYSPSTGSGVDGVPLREVEAHDTVHLVPDRWMATIALLGQHLRVLSPGMPFMERKPHGLKPHPALALNSRCKDLHATEMLDVDHEQALCYLRGEAMTAASARGERLVTHQGVALGWVNGAGNRWNSGWPKAWRIRMR